MCSFSLCLLVTKLYKVYVNETKHTLCLKNDTDVAHYNFNAHQPILVIFGTGTAERICY